LVRAPVSSLGKRALVVRTGVATTGSDVAAESEIALVYKGNLMVFSVNARVYTNLMQDNYANFMLS
jgi:hypothetical protein